MTKNDSSRYLIYCEYCSYKKIIENDSINLVEIPQSKIQINIDKTGVNKESKFIEQNKKFKCPKCGRGVRAKIPTKPYQTLLEKKDIEVEKQRVSAELQKRIEDGLPINMKDLDEKENNNT